MGGPLDEIRRLLRTLKLDDSLLFLGHLLAVSREEVLDPGLERWVSRLKSRPPDFVILFMAKLLILEANNFRSRVLDFHMYKKLQDLFFQLDDPISHDPDWVNAETTGFFERLLGNQIPLQSRFKTRDIGLPLALFRDAGTPRKPGDYDLKGELESELAMPIEEFIALGYLCRAVRFALGIRGTFTPMYLAEAFKQGFTWCRPETWEPFLKRVARTRDEFRSCCNRPEYRVKDSLFVPFEFNPLYRFPVLDVGGSRFVAVDPELVLKRATWGLFFDMFERDGTSFSRRFGDVFERLVGEMLQSVVAKQSLWSDAERNELPGRQASKQGFKRGDWAYKGAHCTVLFECKTLRPSLPLRHYGQQEHIDEFRRRVVSGLEQVVVQSQAIQAGAWDDEGFTPSPAVCVLVSYGRFYTANYPPFRNRVRKLLMDKGYTVPPFVVLSIEEFDLVIRLTERGRSLDELLLQVAESDGSIDVLRPYHVDLEGNIISSTFSHSKNQEFEDALINIPAMLAGLH